MKSKLFKHMSLPEMYSLDVDKDNKVYFEVNNLKRILLRSVYKLFIGGNISIEFDRQLRVTFWSRSERSQRSNLYNVIEQIQWKRFTSNFAGS